MGDTHIVTRCKINGEDYFFVMRDDGLRVTRRKTARAASEAADLLMRGLSREQLPEERMQILRWLPPLRTGPANDQRRPFGVKTESGYVVRRFLLDFQAKWWHTAYMYKRQELLKEKVPPISWKELSALWADLERGKS